MTDKEFTRRSFLFGTAATLVSAGCSTGRTRSTTLAKSGFQSPNEKLNIAGIGVGGKGRGDIDTCNSENIVALCDVDWNNAARAFDQYPKAKRFRDHRVMLETCKDIDAVTVSTPDHMHAYAAMRCMEMGKHVYVQKPLAQTVFEVRTLREAAHRYGVATQMGNQGAASDQHREVCEMIWAGLIGQVHEVHSWTDRADGWWPQGISEALPEQPVPDQLDWDLWLGTAPHRSYNKGYCPFRWRGWWDFGCGALGDIACHSLSPVAKALCLEYPCAVQNLHQEEANRQTFPTKSIIRYEFSKRGNFDPLNLYWYDGRLKPELPQGVGEEVDLLGESSGTMFVGEGGIILMRGQPNENWLIVDGKRIHDFEKPAQIVPRIPTILNREGTGQSTDRMHKVDWILSCKTGSASSSNFDHAGPLSEWVVMGNISLKFPGQTLEWDGPKMRFKNCRSANRYVTKRYRKGWDLI